MAKLDVGIGLTMKGEEVRLLVCGIPGKESDNDEEQLRRVMWDLWN